MKKRAWLTGCFVMLLCMAGCGSPSIEVSDGKEPLTVSEITTKEDEEPVGVAGSKEPKDKDGMVSALGDNGELLKEGSLCGFQYQLGENEDYDSNYKDRGYYRYENDARAPLVLELCSGEHSTGGYGISIVNIEADEAGNLCVTVEEMAPDLGAVVTEAFTYPKVTLLVYEETKMPGSVTVKTTGGAEFPFLGSMPPRSETEDKNSAKQDENAWKKLVFAPPEGAYCNISLSLPEDWNYSWGQSEDVPVSDVSIGIYPKAEGDANGSITIEYVRGFGVCGTGLVSEKTTFNEHDAYVGTYDNHPYWDFISLESPYEGCVIINGAGGTWFEKYKDELSEILATVEFEIVTCDGVPRKDFSEKDAGEIYMKDLTESDVVVSTDGVKYVKNQLLVSAKMDCTREKMENLGSAYGFEIVGYIELTQDYQIEFTRDMEEADLLKMIKILEEEDCISMCTLNYVMDIAID
ncbi:MAG: protease complex subunit PrcB family protein [Lachnospiraceae bacterium]|nr:protease complex subunit PrcB family protein [Lachnospiraceae bacterium]